VGTGVRSAPTGSAAGADRIEHERRPDRGTLELELRSRAETEEEPESGDAGEDAELYGDNAGL